MDTSLNLTGKNTLSAFRWLMRKQNHDGSWGANDVEKIRWTANAVLSLSLFFQADHKPKNYKRAIAYLKKYSKEKPDWYLRVPALIAADQTDWLIKRGEIEKLINLIDNNEIDNFYVKVALAIAVMQHGLSDVTKSAIEQEILQKVDRHGSNMAAIGRWHSDTTLCALFLSLASEKKNKKLVADALRWVSSSSLKTSGGGTHWGGHGRSAYVGINLAEIGALTSTDKLGLDSALSLLDSYVPQPAGNIPEDSLPALESVDTVYTTILYLRLLGNLSHRYPEIGLVIFREMINQAWIFVPKIETRSQLFIKALGTISIFVLITILLSYMSQGTGQYNFVLIGASAILASATASIISHYTKYFLKKLANESN